MTYVFDFGFLKDTWPDLLYGTWLTIRMSVLSLVPGFALGCACTLLRIYGAKPVSRLVIAYVELIRNTPVIIQVFWIFFGLAALQFRVPALSAAVMALVINVSAYVSEILRAGFESIPEAQHEAAASLALTKRQTIWFVELPQAVEKVYPALVSQFILMLLVTSIMSQISAEELTGVADQIQAATFRSFESYIVVAVIYLLLVSLTRFLLLKSALVFFPRARQMREVR
ncbi:MAG: polar amino acid transporter, inner rane subunit [Herminiimonas sp.]|nr:polar amino acid transporter, inner rane subunit [Herminiimonas sp.]